MFGNYRCYLYVIVSRQVDSFMRAGADGVYAAGDVANFPYWCRYYCAPVSIVWSKLRSASQN